MSEKTNFFGDNNSSESNKELMVLSNFRDIPDDAVVQVLDKLMHLYQCTKTVIDAFDKKISPDVEPEELVGLEEDEFIGLIIEEPLEDLDYAYYDELSKQIFQEYYFKSNYSFDIFMPAINTIITHLGDLKKALETYQPFDYEEKHKESLEQAFYNLNYCILHNFKLFHIEDGEILSGVRSYLTNSRLSAETLINPMLKIWKEHKPTISYFNNHPDILEDLEKVLDAKTLSELMNYVNVVKGEEWQDIINKKAIVDDEYLNMMEERYYRETKSLDGDSYDG